MTHVLVVAATREEAAYVPPGLPLLITGVGKTAAASAVSRALAEHPHREDLLVVNIGTAGALRDGLAGIHEPGRVVNHEISAEAIRSIGLEPHEVLTVGAGDLVLATGDMFVTDPSVRARLAQRAQLVDMEGYAVAYAAAQFGVEVRLVKHVSDNADESAHDWSAVVDDSARDLGEWLRVRFASECEALARRGAD